ncbi:MAG: S8/S53 family peptidase [Minicystis sp.]
MTIHRQAWIAGIVAILGASGCGGEGSGAPEPLGEAASALVAPVCPGTQQIGRVEQGDTCPAPIAGDAGSQGGWTVDRLFAGLAPTLPPELSAFCVYTWTGSGPPSFSSLPSYHSAPPSSWLDPDCMAGAAMADSDIARGALTPELEQAFAAELETPATLPAAPIGGPVRVAVVDAWPGVGRVGNFDHGFGMAAIARRIACGPGPSSCFLTAAPHLALDLVAPDVHNVFNGGFFGYQSRLARAIVEAVTARAATAPDDKLVINLSVGWDSRYNVGPDGLISEPVIAVRTALEFAACQGALVIAAAGNAGSGLNPGVGPVSPAAWESIAAPTCAGPVTRPLVYAIGGLDGRDLPLANTRPGGLPRLAAPAYMAPGVMNDSSGPVITGPFTGSSVAAAVASGIAASVWHQDPSLRPDQVMAYLHASAVVSPIPADFCLGASCGVVRRLSLCRALEAVTMTALSCTKIPFAAGHNPTWSAADRATIEGLVTHDYSGTDLVDVITPSICSSEVYVPSGSTHTFTPYPCPQEQLPNSIVMPTVGPNPPPDPCPACSVYIGRSSESVLLLSISSRVAVAYPQVMSLRDRTGVVARYDLASAKDSADYPLGKGLYGGQVYRVALPPITDTFDYATIEWVPTVDAETTSFLIVGY